MSEAALDIVAAAAALESCLAEYPRVVVAYSGGVDSSLVAFVAGRVLGQQALAVTSASPSLKRADLALAKRLAAEWGLRHRVIVTDELGKADYRANPVDRCFHCKTSLYDALAPIARAEGDAAVLNGTNLDDLGDHRPGLVAAAEHGVRSPLVEAGFNKAAVRALAAHYGLANAQKPQAACLSSRFPYGTAIDPDKLAQVEAAEQILEQFGFSQYRVRHHEDVARLELLPDELTLALTHRTELEQRIRALGYRFVALDLAGFKSGSLNAGIIPTTQIE